MSTEKENMAEEILSKVKKNRKKLLGFGILSLLFGFIGMFAVTVMTLTSVIVFGILMLFVGILFFGEVFDDGDWKEKFWDLSISVLYVLSGIIIILNPVKSAEWFTLLLSILFVLIGVSRIIMAFVGEKKGIKIVSLIVFGGLLSILIGILIYIDWPESSLWVIGMFVSIEFMIQGILAILISNQVHDGELKAEQVKDVLSSYTPVS